MNLGEEIAVHEIVPEQVPYEGEEIASDQPNIETEETQESETTEHETVEV